MRVKHHGTWRSTRPKKRPKDAPALLTTRPAACSRCGGSLVDEPFAVRCRICGHIFYLVGEDGAQDDFERKSGLVGSAISYITPMRSAAAARGFYAPAQ